MNVEELEINQHGLLPSKVYHRAYQLILDTPKENKSVKKSIESILAILEECLFLNMGRVLLPDHNKKYLRIRYAHGLPMEKRFITYQIDHGVTGFVFTSRQAIYIDDLVTNSMYTGKLVNPLDLPYSKPAFTGVPIFDQTNEVIGVLCVNHGYRTREEISSTITLLEEASKVIANLLEKAP